MSEERLMGRNEYARHRGCAPNAVKKAEDSGRISAAVERDPSGAFIGIDWRNADELWAANTDPDESLRNGKVPGAIPPAPVTSTQHAEGDELAGSAPGAQLELEPAEDDAQPQQASRSGEDPHGYLAARAERERHAAKLAELNLRERMGELVSAVDVREVQFDIYRQHRDKLEQLVADVSERVAGETDPQRVESLLRSEIRKTLNELSRAFADDADGGTAERSAATA